MSWLKQQAAAEYLGTNPRHLRALSEEGRIPHSKLGRFNVYNTDDLDAYLAATRREATQGPLAQAPARRGRRSA